MLTRTEIIIKWTLYGMATILCFIAQGVLGQQVTIWGVIPFLYPMLAVIPATFEAPVPSTIFSLCVGVACDSLLPEPFPCVYTLLFPVIGLFSSLLAESILRKGFLCSLVCTALAFLVTGLGHCLLLAIQGRAAWSTGFFLTFRELLVTLPFSFPVTVLYRAVFRKTHVYD